ncbi:type 4a pilus biogenesis protein PilO [Candidatus Saccharibacteria bacterium]|nr:type 4a pilus biogenesis protein PilO [Candidatus Saccharibacteria bacterium]
MAQASILNRPEVKTYGPPLLLVILGILLIPLVALPTWGGIQELNTQIQNEQERIQILETKSQKLLDLADQSTLLDENYALFEAAITSESKIPELLTQIQSVSDSCGLSVETLQFGGETSEVKGQVPEVRVRYASKGTFLELTCLVLAFENSLRLVDIDSLRYTSGETEGGGTILSPEVTFVAYYTPTAILNPDRPVTFSFTDPSYTRALEILETLK